MATVSGHFYCLTFYYATEYELGNYQVSLVFGLLLLNLFFPKTRLARNHGLEFQDHRETSSAHDFSHSRAELAVLSRYYLNPRPKMYSLLVG